MYVVHSSIQKFKVGLFISRIPALVNKMIHFVCFRPTIEQHSLAPKFPKFKNIFFEDEFVEDHGIVLHCIGGHIYGWVLFQQDVVQEFLQHHLLEYSRHVQRICILYSRHDQDFVAEVITTKKVFKFVKIALVFFIFRRIASFVYLPFVS